MKLYSINTFTSSERTRIFHYEMFHGAAEPDETLPGNAHFLGHDLSRQLRLRRNGARVPDVFRPVNTFIVSERARAALKPFPNAEFLEVAFTKLIDFPYQAGDFSYEDSLVGGRRTAVDDPVRLIEELPDVPELHRRTGPYYELVVPRLQDIKGRYPGKVMVTCEPWYIIGEVELELSPALVEENPMFFCYCMFFNAAAFEAIKPFIDWDYFSLFELDF